MNNLFQLGAFTLHGGQHSAWKIECDALTSDDIAALAVMLREILPEFGSVEGVPRGGLRIADALKPFVTTGPLLIVDDVLTTGRSMDEHRDGRDAIGAVIFARGPCQGWVTPLFTMPTKGEASTVSGHHKWADIKKDKYEILRERDAALARVAELEHSLGQIASGEWIEDSTAPSVDVRKAIYAQVVLQRDLHSRIAELETAIAPILNCNGGPLTIDGVCQFCYEEVYLDAGPHKPDCFVLKEKSRR